MVCAPVGVSRWTRGPGRCSTERRRQVDRDSESRIAELELENESLEEDVRRLTLEVEGLKSQLDDKDRLIVEARGSVDRAVSDLRDVIRDLVT